MHQQVEKPKVTTCKSNANSIYQLKKNAQHGLGIENNHLGSISELGQINPSCFTQSNIISLQRSIGNKAVSRLMAGLGNSADHSTRQQQPIQKKENNTGLPGNLKSGIENLSGYSMNDVKVHYNSEKPAQLQAYAYTQGTDIHIASGQEKHLPHEAWHVVQQKQGRVKPTMKMKGEVSINNDTGLEKEAGVMAQKAFQMKTTESEYLKVGSFDIPVVQRQMGLEAETRRIIQNPNGKMIEKGDTDIIKHEYFTLVTDKFDKTSNLEFVMKHFDQLAGSEAEAIGELTKRIKAMEDLNTKLYANEGKLKDIVLELGTAPMVSIYTPQNVEYKDKRGTQIKFNSQDTLIKAAEANVEDNKLYVHYTVGFPPKHWKKMIQSIHKFTRDDTDKSRPKTIAMHALEMVDNYSGEGLTNDEREEAKGHLALMYMQMSVWIDRTADKQKVILCDERKKKLKDVMLLKAQIKSIENNANKNLLEKDNEKRPLMKKLKAKERNCDKIKKKIEAINSAIEFGKGLPKNKIAALPRATLNEMFGVLSNNVQIALKRDKEKILDLFAETLEKKFQLDLNQGLELENNDLGQLASLGNFLEAGLGSNASYSQQLLFGGMTEVGIDNSSQANPNLLPLEFRSIYKHRVTWSELLSNAIDVLKWSRKP